MAKQNLFEYVKLNKQELVSQKTGNPYTRYVVVSDQNMETKKIASKLGPLGFKWNGREWWIFGNQLSKAAVDSLKEINKELETQGGQTGDIGDFLAKLEEFKAELGDVENIPIKTKTELEANLEQYIEDIANATDERAASAAMRKFLNFSTQFHQYSWNNIMYIFLQDPNATRVAGKNKWKEMGRTIIDPSKAITINCGNKFYRNPRTGEKAEYTLKQQTQDREYLQKVQSGEIPMDRNKVVAIENRKNIIHIGFKPCVVYDIANTTGNPIVDEPLWKASNDKRADAIALFSVAKKSLEDMGVRVTQEPATAGESGWSMGGQINVSADASGTGAASIIFREWAHQLLNQRGGKFYEKAQDYFVKKGELNPAQIKQIRKIQEETVSATLCKHFNLSTEYQPTYMALMQAQGGLNSKQLIRENISTIASISNFILKQMDKYKDEIEAAKASITQSQQPQQ